MRRKRRNHSSVFKAKVAVASIKGEKTLAQLSEQFDIHANQIQEWRRRLLDNVEALFGRGAQRKEETEGTIKDLHAKIGQLTMERDFLEQGLERIHGPSGKK